MYEAFIAWRHLKSKRKSFISTITLISMAGVVLGVTALTAVVSVNGGFQEAFREKVLGVNSHIGGRSACGGRKRKLERGMNEPGVVDISVSGEPGAFLVELAALRNSD